MCSMSRRSRLRCVIVRFVSNASLGGCVSVRKHILPRGTVRVVRRILSTITLTRGGQVVRESVGPRGVLVSGRSHVGVASFNVTITLSRASVARAGALLKSIRCLSPRRTENDVTASGSSVCTLNIILCRLLDKSIPFSKRSTIDITLGRFRRPVPSVERDRPRVPRDLRGIVLGTATGRPLSHCTAYRRVVTSLSAYLDRRHEGRTPFVPMSLLRRAGILAPLSTRMITGTSVRGAVVSPPRDIGTRTVRRFRPKQRTTKNGGGQGG